MLQTVRKPHRLLKAIKEIQELKLHKHRVVVQLQDRQQEDLSLLSSLAKLKEVLRLQAQAQAQAQAKAPVRRPIKEAALKVKVNQQIQVTSMQASFMSKEYFLL